jgi:hypothetical protein
LGIKRDTASAGAAFLPAAMTVQKERLTFKFRFLHDKGLDFWKLGAERQPSIQAFLRFGSRAIITQKRVLDPGFAPPVFTGFALIPRIEIGRKKAVPDLPKNYIPKSEQIYKY